jgi:hypothetical protein
LRGNAKVWIHGLMDGWIMRRSGLMNNWMSGLNGTGTGKRVPGIYPRIQKSIHPLFCLLLVALLCGCATPHPAVPARARAFDFEHDTFAYPNELLWVYNYDANGKWVTHRREPPPTYWQHCFVMARATRQFFLNARFDAQQPIATEAAYRRLIRRIVASNPRHALPKDKKIVIPGYPDLRAFSQAEEKLLKAECGGAWQSYVQRGHWRVVFPFSRKGQQRMAERLEHDLQSGSPVVVHLVRFPRLTINHAMVFFRANQTQKAIEFTAYDPNDPSKPVEIAFDRASRCFLLPANNYFPGGRVDAYEVYGSWAY